MGCTEIGGSNSTLSATAFSYAVLLATCERSSETVRHKDASGAMLLWLAGCVFALRPIADVAVRQVGGECAPL